MYAVYREARNSGHPVKDNIWEPLVEENCNIKLLFWTESSVEYFYLAFYWCNHTTENKTNRDKLRKKFLAYLNKSNALEEYFCWEVLQYNLFKKVDSRQNDFIFCGIEGTGGLIKSQQINNLLQRGVKNIWIRFRQCQ